MKFFIYRTLPFVYLPLLGVIICLLILNVVSREIFALKGLNTPNSTVFIGDSHIEAAIEDKLFENCVNLGRSSESLYFSYYRLKVLVENNPNIKNVYLGLGYHSISSYYDKFIDGEFSNAISSKYFFLLPAKEKLDILLANKHNLSGYLKAIIKNGILNIVFGDTRFQGNSARNFSNVTAKKKSIDERILLQYYNGNNQNGFSSRNIEALVKIRDFCNKNSINLTLINTPVYKLYKINVPKRFIDKCNKLPDSLKVQYLDLNNLLSQENLFMPDGDHVNNKGAVMTSEYLVKKID